MGHRCWTASDGLLLLVRGTWLDRACKNRANGGWMLLDVGEDGASPFAGMDGWMALARGRDSRWPCGIVAGVVEADGQRDGFQPISIGRDGLRLLDRAKWRTWDQGQLMGSAAMAAERKMG
ncbi:hypothetical protein ACLOJK_019003 [Asimina triloba]